MRIPTVHINWAIAIGVAVGFAIFTFALMPALTYAKAQIESRLKTA